VAVKIFLINRRHTAGGVRRYSLHIKPLTQIQQLITEIDQFLKERDQLKNLKFKIKIESSLHVNADGKVA
jgi:hypothetical protein